MPEKIPKYMQLYGQQVDLDAAAAAKAITGREALTHAPIDSQGPKAVGTVITFDVPGAGTTGTLPSGMNAEGVITGTYYDVNSVGHGFLRFRNGSFATFDAPGAALIGTIPSGINPEGAITGTYYDLNFVGHGFLRARDGTFTTFNPPGSIAVFAPDSFGPDLSMNPDGVITGTYFEPISGNPFGVNHGILQRRLFH